MKNKFYCSLTAEILEKWCRAMIKLDPKRYKQALESLDSLNLKKRKKEITK